MTVAILDANGRFTGLRSKWEHGNTMEVETSCLTPGAYFYVVRAANGYYQAGQFIKS